MIAAVSSNSERKAICAALPSGMGNLRMAAPDGSATSRRLDNLLCCGGGAHGRGVARGNVSPHEFQFSRYRTRLRFSICLPLHPRPRTASLSAHKFVRGPDLFGVVGRADL